MHPVHKSSRALLQLPRCMNSADSGRIHVPKSCFVFRLLATKGKHASSCIFVSTKSFIFHTRMIRQNCHPVFPTATGFSQHLILLAAVWLPLWVKPERCGSDGALDQGRRSGCLCQHIHHCNFKVWMATGTVWWEKRFHCCRIQLSHSPKARSSTLTGFSW